MSFDPAAARGRLTRLWSLPAAFGMERTAYRVYLDEIVSDRYCLVNGLQLLRDELQLAVPRSGADDDLLDLAACGADLSLPTVLTTLAHTNCGDRIHHAEATLGYQQMVGSRFASLSELGDLKPESFFPTGGGTDDGATLAHVTLSHQLDASLRRRLYEGNRASFVLINVDLSTHVGRLDEEGRIRLGMSAESSWREPRAACGAIVGTLTGFNAQNAVHARLRRDLGEENFQLLTKRGVVAEDGTEVTPAVAAAIVAVQGMLNTLDALAKEADERTLGHMTATLTVNRVGRRDTLIYLARGTQLGGERRVQGFGTDASRYGARTEKHAGEARLVLTYEDRPLTGFPIAQTR